MIDTIDPKETMVFNCASHSESNKVFVIMKNNRHYHVYLDTMGDNADHVREHVAEFFTEGAAKYFVKKMAEK
jgi:hypothetical protein